MACTRNAFTVTWRLENYNFFFEKPGHALTSPPFVISTVQNATWMLWVISNSIQRNEHIGFGVDRKVRIRTILELDFEISIFRDDDSSPLFENSYVHTYTKSDESLKCYVPHQEVYVKIRDAFVLPKTLTIRCRMYEHNGSFLEAEQNFIRSRIRVERIAFVAFLENFSSLVPAEKRYLTVKSTSKKQLFALKINLADDLCIEILPLKKDYIKFCVCKLFLLDFEGVKTECARSEILFVENESKEWKLPLSFTKSWLTGRSTKFLSNDILSLKCEFTFSTGVEYEEIEDNEVVSRTFGSKQSSKFSSALEDLTSLYEEGILCDMKLITDTETFNVHKNILSARSSVFKTMFTTDMREKATDSVVIKDLNADTVRRMLLFLYADKLDYLNWESTKKLYFAADKYNIVSLKYRCSRFLKSRLEMSNCCELLVLSDRHCDLDLKKTVQEYIAEHSDAILQTDQWINIEQNIPKLTIETLRGICLGSFTKRTSI